MSNAYEEAKKLAREKARETTVYVSLSVLQDILSELQDAKDQLRRLEDRARLKDTRQSILDAAGEPVENVRQIVTKIGKEER